MSDEKKQTEETSQEDKVVANPAPPWLGLVEATYKAIDTDITLLQRSVMSKLNNLGYDSIAAFRDEMDELRELANEREFLVTTLGLRISNS